MSPSVIDRLTLERHLMALDRAVTQLRQHSGKPVEILDESLDELWIVERGLLVCAQNALDIATHIASSSGRDVPDYATAIDRLSELGVLTPTFAGRFRAIAGFRNLLVHGYLEVDRRRLHAILNDRLEDFVEFSISVLKFLGDQG